jgi:hypothetical protein
VRLGSQERKRVRDKKRVNEVAEVVKDGKNEEAD